MLALIAAVLLGQQPVLDPMAYVRAHRDADNALVAGNLAAARAGFASCLEMSPRNATVAYALACTEARAGDKDKALDWFERAAEWNYADRAVASWDDDLASVGNEKRFADLLERMGRGRPEPESGPVLVRFWDARGSEITRALTISPSADLVAVGRDPGFIRLLDARTGHALRDSPRLDSEVWALEFDNSGKHVVALTWDGKLHLWEIDGRSEPRTLNAIPAWKGSCRAGTLSSEPVLMSPSTSQYSDHRPYGHLQFDSSGQRLLVSGSDRGVSLMKSSGERIREWSDQESWVTPAWSPDGTRIAMPLNEFVQFVNGETGEPAEVHLTTPCIVLSAVYSPCGNLIATGHADNRFRVWDVKSRELRFEQHFADMFDANLDVNQVAFSPDGRWIAGGTRNWGYVRIFDTQQGTRVSEIAWGEKPGDHEWAKPYEFSWSADSKRLWLALDSGLLESLSLAPENYSPKLQGVLGRVHLIRKSGLCVVSGLRSVLLFDEKSGRCRWDSTNLSREGEILKTSTGHFTTNLERFDDLLLDASADESAFIGYRTSLASKVEVLFDPKRVRAARDGVAIVPVKFY